MSSYAHIVHTTAKHVISRRGKNENVFKMSKNETCTCKACKNTVFHCQICKFETFLLPSSSWLLKLPNNDRTHNYTANLDHSQLWMILSAFFLFSPQGDWAWGWTCAGTCSHRLSHSVLDKHAANVGIQRGFHDPLPGWILWFYRCSSPAKQSGWATIAGVTRNVTDEDSRPIIVGNLNQICYTRIFSGSLPTFHAPVPKLIYSRWG